MLRSPREREWPASRGDGPSNTTADSTMTRRVVQVALTIYLSPVIAAVLLIGATSLVAIKLSRVAGRIIAPDTAGAGHDGPLVAADSGRSETTPHLATKPRRAHTAH